MSKQLEERVAFLEAEVARLSKQLEGNSTSESGWEDLIGIFANDPGFEEVVRLGREWRESDSLPWESEDAEAQMRTEAAPNVIQAIAESKNVTSDSKASVVEGMNVHP